MTDPERSRRAFRDLYGRDPRLFRAPGRVNLIGEHTDYNDGFVLPIALDRDTLVAAAPRPDRRLRARSADHGEEGEIDLDAPPPPRRGTWLDYVEGTARVLEERIGPVPGADLLVAGDVPEGAGLSSSAALEMAVAAALASLAGWRLDRRALALAGQAAEHRFVGTRCGIMDQLVSMLGEAGHALLIDCRSLETRPIPLPPDRAAILVFDSGVRHRHSSGEYNVRRAQCEEAAARLGALTPGVRALRDVAPDDLERHAAALGEPLRRRARHVVSEIHRTALAASALSRGDLAGFGRLMFASHASLRDDFEVSVPELDTLVQAARSAPGVLGARMTGGGFGGCTVTLAEAAQVEAAGTAIAAAFALRFGRAPAWFVTRAADGAGEIAL
ncbi:MAG TPA: galactokinase [Vicinamibacteria bacterium]|nr:galactokinase [Vicinamibacteria bacterium]